MKGIKDAARKISPGPDRGLLKRVQRETGIRYETLISWGKRGIQRSSYPVQLLWAILEVLADDGTLAPVIERAREKIHHDDGSIGIVTHTRYSIGMSKIIKCPVCGDKKPVRNDAKVCSPACRLKRWRAGKKKRKQ